MNFNIDNKLTMLSDFSQKTRRELHQIPEPAGQEIKTSNYCQSLMRKMGYSLTTYEHFTGFIADLTINPQWHRIAFRADMDALSMPDLTENEYKSKHEGFAHNCGHDTHMAIALTAAKYLAENTHELKHNLRFIFQMAEENALIPGADKMVELGCMEGIAEVYALHNDASMECGFVSLNNGIMSSYGSTWILDIEGKSAHGSTPHKGLDAIREASRIITEMDFAVAKCTDPFSPAVFGCGMLSGGSVPNAVPANARAKGTIRAMDLTTDTILKDCFATFIKESELRGFNTQLQIGSYPAIINHALAYQRVIDAASATVPSDRLNGSAKPMTGSEDFSFMINACEGKKGAMFFIGSGNKALGIKNYIHSNPYYVDDDFLIIAAQIFIRLATS